MRKLLTRCIIDTSAFVHHKHFQSGPAMTWGMHAIGHLELGQEEQAAEMFDKSYLPYVQVPTIDVF